MENESKWFYARNGQRHGPMAFEELHGLVRAGQIPASTLVWTDGMAQWTPVSEVSELAPVSELASAAPVQAAPAAQPLQVGYYTSAMGIPMRAMETLKGHAPPSGDTGDWPLDDQRISQFQETVKIRARVTGAGKLYRLLLLLTAIGTVFMFLGGLVAMAQGGRRGQAFMVGAILPAVFCIGFCVLYYFVARATMHAQRWAPLTMFILFLAGLAFQGISIFFAGMNGPNPEPAIIILSFAIFLEIVFAVVSWRSFAAIPKYLAQPAWCQELIVKAGL